MREAREIVSRQLRHARHDADVLIAETPCAAIDLIAFDGRGSRCLARGLDIRQVEMLCESARDLLLRHAGLQQIQHQRRGRVDDDEAIHEGRMENPVVAR
jgi:hypothetical protein